MPIWKDVDSMTCMLIFKIFAGYADASFLATFDEITLTPTDPIVFNYPVLNPGGHYNPNTGIYTIPIDGVYEFIFQLWSDGDRSIYSYLNVDGVQVSYTPNILLAQQ